MDGVEQVMQRAKARMQAAQPGSAQAEILYMDEGELSVWAEWRGSLPSQGELAKQARARLLEKKRKRDGAITRSN